MAEKRLKVYAKLKVYYDTPSFGYGVCELMKRIKKLGSLSAACEDMGMAYSKGWRILKEAQKDMNVTLVSGVSGGAGGGGSRLTADGERLLRAFEGFYDEAKAYLEELAKKHFS